jgi:hypothetical protein
VSRCSKARAFLAFSIQLRSTNQSSLLTSYSSYNSEEWTANEICGYNECKLHLKCGNFVEAKNEEASSFEERVIETLKNPQGQRRLTDHLRRLAEDIHCLVKDGVEWRWIADRIGKVRQSTASSAAYTATVRTTWARIKSEPDRSTGSSRAPPRAAFGRASAPPPGSKDPEANASKTDRIHKRAERKKKQPEELEQ